MRNHGHDQQVVNHFFETLLADDEMIETKAYLKRGRKFKCSESAQLQAEWADAFKIWFASKEPGDLQIMDDIGAELRLRDLPIPFDAIRSEIG